MKQKWNLIFWLTVLMIAFAVMPVLGQAVSITVTPAWSVATTLTSLDTNGAAFPIHDAGDDYRYVSASLYATTNVEFWALQITCTVPVATLQGYTPDPSNSTTPTDPGDWREMIEPGPAWGIAGLDYVMIPSSFNTTTGAMTLTISRQGQTTPMGANGQSRNMLLATFSYRVKSQQQVATFSGTVPFTCSSIAFLNRSAAVVGAATFTPATPLNVSSGLTLSGTAQYQARTVHTGIGVSCQDNGNIEPPRTTRTLATGAWSIPNIRVQDWYTCYYFGQLVDNEVAPAVPVDEADVYLPVQVSVNLGLNINQSVMPVVLPLGNATRDNIPEPYVEEEIDTTDISAVTLAYGTNYPATTNFGSGDVNNDKMVNRADLVLVAGNFGLGNGNTWSEHLIVSAQRAPSVKLYDNRIWVNSSVNTGSDNTPLRQLITGTNRDYWPALSPDGTKIAFTRAVQTGTGTATRLYYQLFVQNADGTGVATRITPLPSTTWTFDALAPSWSADGTRIAFVASYTDGLLEPTLTSCACRESYSNSGALYVVDVTGRNLRQVADGSKVYPPAWLNNDTLVFGGSDWHETCTNTICITSVSAPIGDGEMLDFVDLPVSFISTEFYDMPNIRNGRLYYRYQSDFDDTRLRVANLDMTDILDGDVVEAHNADPDLADNGDGFYHIDVEYNTGGDFPVSSYVDYYIISNNDGARIIYYEYEYSSFDDYYYTDPSLVYSTVDDVYYGEAPTFSVVEDSYLIEVGGNPVWDTYDFESELFALRVTFFLAP